MIVDKESSYQKEMKRRQQTVIAETEGDEKVKKESTNNNEYLKLLQKNQLEDKVDMELEKIMNAFFRKEKKSENTPKSKPPLRLMDEYMRITEDDVMKHHGHITL